ncbi:transforming growth factor-beta-induced protein ig-h3-like [Ruditapes philippinarum]|uniref:transforming growth factor-beta-induced protein ig-h3-like n=1 Tax=Ruditapes philippinarum TaxID=129788 RepID=UPI00295ABF92|nr:transforming growth factor-beta-induced protein ig-h3-like [Ruditapes philippinarum]
MLTLGLTITCMLWQGIATQTLLEVATSLNASLFVKYVQDSGLAPAFTKNGQFTLFIPTDDAFNALPSDVKMQLTKEPELLRKVLMFHGVDGIKYSSMLSDELEVESLVMDAKIRINIYNNPKPIVLASGSEVIRTDINATNGVIHLLSRVMYPLPTADAVQFMAQNNQLGTLLYSVAMTPLRGILQAGGPFTIFAPNNDAFNKLPVGYWSDLFNQNYTAYVDMLKYHVVQGTIYSEGLKSGPLTSYTRQTLHVHVNHNGVMINNGTVVQADQTIKNGVIHIVDRVLIPGP